VRPEADFNGEQGHIEGALLMPLEELSNNISDIEKFKEKEIMIVCRTDRRSSKAAQYLTKNGFVNVNVVKQGMTDWNKKGYSVSR
jgi:rhodanese-related sulfurtransferase